MVRRWLRRDALNRAWRSIWHSVIASALLGAGDAAWQAVRPALVDSAAGTPVDWSQAGRLAGYAALTACATPVIAYVHRRWLDPSRVPSALPPTPPTPPGLR